MSDLDDVDADTLGEPGTGSDLPGPRRRARRWGAVAAGSVGLLVVAALVVTLRSDDDAVEVGPLGDGAVPLGDGAVPSPLFDDVEQLTPTALPAGWARCGGGRSDFPGATADSWAQTFGPVVGGLHGHHHPHPGSPWLQHPDADVHGGRQDRR